MESVLSPNQVAGTAAGKRQPRTDQKLLPSQNTQRPMLRRISNRQMEKIEDHLPTPKIKLILKEKGRKFHPVRRHSEGSAASSAKSSSKTNTWSEEDQEVSQYLTFEDHEAPQILRVSD